MTTWCGWAESWALRVAVPCSSKSWWWCLQGPEPVQSQPEMLGPEGRWDSLWDDVILGHGCSGQHGHGGAYEPVVPLPVQAGGLVDEQHAGGIQWTPTTTGPTWPPYLATWVWPRKAGWLTSKAWSQMRWASTMARRMRAWSSSRRWTPTGMPSTSKAICTQTCCCRTSWCPTWGWCCCSPAGVPPHKLWLQAPVPCAHRWGHAGGAQSQGDGLRAAAPGEGPGHIRDQVPTGPCGDPPLHFGHRRQHARCGCNVLWPTKYPPRSW